MIVSARSLRHSLASVVAGNFASNAVSLGSQLLLMPVYIRAFGFEGFGIISFLHAVLLALDLGLGNSVSRAVADAACRTKETLCRTIRSFEAIYVLAAVGVCLLADIAGQLVANQWLKLESMTAAEARNALFWGFLMIGSRWTLFFFQNALRGLERQNTANMIVVVTTLIRTVIALVVALNQGDIAELFMALLAASVLEAMVFYFTLHRASGVPHLPRLYGDVLRGNLQFVSHLWLASVAATILKQLDRILLAGIVSVEAAGVFASAQTAVQIASGIVLPFVNAVYPRWTRLATLGDHDTLSRMVSDISRAIAALASSACIILATVGPTILVAATGESSYTQELSVILLLLCVAAMLNSPMQVALVLALATGRSVIPMATNLIGAIILAPTMYALISNWGLFGAGVSWVLFNLAYFAAVPRVVFAGCKGLSTRAWYLQDNAFPVFTVALVLSPGLAAKYSFDASWEYVLAGQLVASLPVVYIWTRAALKHRLVSGDEHTDQVNLR
jgi:PST family polysaccharide transporter